MTGEQSDHWPSAIGALELTQSLATVSATYVDRETGERYTIGCERGGRKRRGWWVKEPDESKRANGYRDFSPSMQAEAIKSLRELADVPTLPGAPTANFDPSPSPSEPTSARPVVADGGEELELDQETISDYT